MRTSGLEFSISRIGKGETLHEQQQKQTEAVVRRGRGGIRPDSCGRAVVDRCRVVCLARDFRRVRTDERNESRSAGAQVFPADRRVSGDRSSDTDDVGPGGRVSRRHAPVLLPEKHEGSFPGSGIHGRRRVAAGSIFAQ